MPLEKTVLPALAPDLHQSLDRIWDCDVSIDPFQNHPLVIGRTAQLKFAFGLAPQGYALEFGVFAGYSIRALAFAHPKRKFTGFDSFTGLPEDWVRSAGDVYEAGHFALDALPVVPANVTLIKGFFDDTLGPWLEANAGPVGFVHIDCDLYGGARHALDLLTPRLVDGAVIVFDELSDWANEGVYPNWAEHEWRALKEWLTQTGWCFRILSRDKGFACAVQIFHTPPAAYNMAQTLDVLTRLEDVGEGPAVFDFLQTDFDAARAPLKAVHLLAKRQLEANEPEAALAVLQQGLSRLGPKIPRTTIRMFEQLHATLLVRCGHVAQAQTLLSEYLQANPDNVHALVLKGTMARQEKSYEEAAALFQRAYHLSGNQAHARQARLASRLAQIRPEFRTPMFSGWLIQHLVDDRSFETVLDVGSGAGEQAALLRKHGKRVTELDYGESHYFKEAEHAGESDILRGDFVTMPIEQEFDCVLASHVLEHQPNVNAFLRKANAVLREGGVLGLSVPPLKHQIVGGHLTVWNAGLVLYNLVLAGFDCRNPWIRRYGYNISVVVEKRSISPAGLVFDNGDIDRIAAYLPEGFGEGFDGDIHSFG
ncbi:methyltransferase domain-containing protein [uncultured Sulfitobacter sp.]|uniref:methyltransferase domain-containing protein n=1 Tax=uncultured Sulfitobacter sp. TaxID=191468 RepID=UPI0026244075|nr:methyltransferase domain-containing protein [uncultured Sulfitobacter sp.]